MSYMPLSGRSNGREPGERADSGVRTHRNRSFHCTAVSAPPVAANEKGGGQCAGTLGVPQLSLGTLPDLIQCQNTNLNCA